MHICSLASQTLTQGGERVWSTAIYRSMPDTPRILAALIGCDDVCGRDIQIRSGRTAGPAKENQYYTSVFGRHVCKQRQNQLMPQEILGVLGTDLYMAVDHALFPPRVRVWLVRLAYLYIHLGKKFL